MATRKKAATKRSNARKKSGSTDAIALLRADHAKVEDLFGQFEQARTDDRKSVQA
jgi:hypothetical protein